MGTSTRAARRPLVRHVIRWGTAMAVVVATISLSGCWGDRFPAIAIEFENRTASPVYLVVSDGEAHPEFDPGPEIRSYLVASGESGWSHGVMLGGDTGLLLVFREDCQRLARLEIGDGAYRAGLEPDETVSVEATSWNAEGGDRLTDSGETCGFASGLDGLPAGPLPTDGPAPVGSVDDQQSAALAALGLEPAFGVSFTGVDRFRWLPAIIKLGALAVRNESGQEIRIPFEFTVLRWTGTEWEREPCPTQIGEQSSVRGLCGWDDGYDLPIADGEEYSGTGAASFRAWPNGEIQPGTYALVVPVKPVPSVGACLIVTITATP